MAYGSIFDAAMNKPMFPGAPGYGGSVTVGQVVRGRQAAMGQTARNARQSTALAVPAGTGYGSLVTKGQVGTNAAGLRPVVGDPRGSSRATGIRNARTTRSAGGNVRAARGVDTGAMHGPLRPPPLPNRPAPTNPVPGTTNPRFKRKTMMGIGLGLGVAASVAMNRRGEGASSGRQSIYKY